MKIELLLFAAVCASLAACTPQLPPQERFAIASSQSETYRIDVVTGQVSRIVGEELKPLRDLPIPLLVGHIYIREDGSRVKYEGKGVFGSAVTVSNWSN